MLMGKPYARTLQAVNMSDQFCTRPRLLFFLAAVAVGQQQLDRPHFVDTAAVHAGYFQLPALIAQPCSLLWYAAQPLHDQPAKRGAKKARRQANPKPAGKQIYRQPAGKHPAGWNCPTGSPA